MAQVDSSIGGKTGINSKYGKNLIGTFYQPNLVISDTEFLKSLPRREVICGYAEILKHSLIMSKKLFNFLNKNGNHILKLEKPYIEKAIYKKNLNLNCKIFGHLSNDEMKLMYKSSELIISAPLKPEGFCRIISEGLSMKKIVLCYNNGGPKEQIFGLDDLYAVEPYDKNQMLKQIKIALNLSTMKKKQMGEIARQHVLKKFSKLENLQKFYMEVPLMIKT